MSKILNFRKDLNAKGFAIRAKSAKKAELVIYGPIGFKDWDGEGITAKEVHDALSGLDKSVDELDIRINSPGGDCFAGIAIYNRLKQFKGKKTVYIDGLAASMASIIALAGDEILIGEGAMYMIHLPWSISLGNRTDMENTINLLMDLEEQMIGIYAKRSSGSRTEIKKWMEEDTWMDADEAIEKGFVTRKSEDTAQIAASVITNAKWIKRTPKGLSAATESTNKRIEELKTKIAGTLARK